MKKNNIILLLLFTLLLSQKLLAQSLEPRLYSNAPLGINFLVVGYNYSTGGLATDPSLGVIDPKINLNVGLLAYVTTYGIFGKSAKLNIVVPTVNLNGDAKTTDGNTLRKDVSGLGDIKAKFSINLFGSPALSKENFKNYKQDLIIGTSIQISVPTGKYEKDKIINIGTNRWATKIGLGASKSINSFAVELLADAEFYSVNSEFKTDIKRKQEPVYSTQAHLIYNIKNGMWCALNANYYWGGLIKEDGVQSSKDFANSRYGFVFAMPINKQNSIKLNGSSGINTRTGADVDSIAIAWQYRWFN